MEIVMGGDLAASFNPRRDWAHAYPRMVMCIAHFFDSGYWPQLFADVVDLHRLRCPQDAEGCSEEEFKEKVWNLVCDAADRYVTFCKMCAGHADTGKKMEELYRESGWLDLPSHIRAAYLAMLGEVMTSQLFHGLREITPLGGGPLPHISTMERELCFARTGRAISQFTTVVQDLRIDLRRLVTCCLSQGLAPDAIRQEVDSILLARGKAHG